MKTRIKKTIYISLTTLLGFLSSGIAIGLIEIRMIDTIVSQDLVPQLYVFVGISSYLPPYILFGFFGIGLIGGYLIGRTWWRMVYVEHRHWRR